MWSLRYEYRHRDCKYLPMAGRLGIILLSYPINSYLKDGFIFTSAIHIVEGETQSVKKYLKHLGSISIKTEQISPNSVFTLAKRKTNLKYYTSMYNPFLFFPRPILHAHNVETGEILSWEKQHLISLVNAMTKNPLTEHFKLLHLRNIPLTNLFLMKLLPRMTGKQRAILEYAVERGYYRYPRAVNLQTISKTFKISPSTCHEILRRAEHNLLTGKTLYSKRNLY